MIALRVPEERRLVMSRVRFKGERDVGLMNFVERGQRGREGGGGGEVGESMAGRERLGEV